MFNYDDYEVQPTRTQYLRFKDFSEGDFLTEKPVIFRHFEEKEMQGPKGKFTAKSFICEDPETNEQIGLPHCGLLAWQIENHVQPGMLLHVQYNGRDDQDRHQTEIKVFRKKGTTPELENNTQ
jgi:hypothetical protein